MTFTATPQPANVPPRVRLDIDADDAGASFTALAVSRDGALIREQPFVGGSEALTFDYEAPFGVPVTYSVSGAFLPTQTPDWTESWASLAAWSGGTASYTVSGGKARSTVTGAEIHRSASGTIQRVDVTDPSYVRVELLTAGDVVVASVQVGANVVVTGTTSTSVAGSGSFTATLVSGTLSVQAVDSSWSATLPYTGVPAKVRIVSLGISYPVGLTFLSSEPNGIAVDSAGSIYAIDPTAKLVRKYNSSGVAGITFSTVGVPRGIAVDSTDNVYVVDTTNDLVRKFTSGGVAGITFSTTASSNGIAVDSAGSIYVLDDAAKLVRKYNSSGVAGITFSTTGVPVAVGVDSSSNVYVVDTTNDLVRKFTSGGVAGITFSTTAGPYSGIAVDSVGSVYVIDNAANLVRKYSSTGVAGITFGPVGLSTGIDTDSTNNVYIADTPADTVRKFSSVTPSVGATSPTLVAEEFPFSATATITLDVDEAWLIHPTQPSLSASIDPGTVGSHPAGLTFVEASSGESKSSAAQRAIHRPVGRTKAVVITHGARQADEWTLVLAAPSFTMRDNLRGMVDDQTPLLLRTSGSVGLDDLPDGWYSVGDVSTQRVNDPSLSQQSLITLPLMPVNEPIVRQGALWTYGTGLIYSATYADSRTAFPTYLDRLAGPES